MTIPTDPMFGAQWHLQNTGLGGLDLNVVDVWDDYTGAGVRVAVIDDGIQWAHPDLVANYDSANDYDYDGLDDDPTGLATNSHGTAVTGLIAANANNGIGGVGVAYDAELIGFRVNGFIGNTFITNMTDAITGTISGDRQADIINMSLGTSYQGNEYDKILNTGRMTDLKRAIDAASSDGRDGLGTLIFKSAGNERQQGIDANVSSWNANRHVVSTAAVEQDGDISYYSTFGANILISGFGTSGSVRTTDRVGSEGYSSDDYTTSFNGTSAATPMISGVAALMLEANENLGWRDVHEILAYSARHVGSDIGAPLSGDEEYAWVWNGADNWNAGGLHFSNDYGYGLVDALTAVRLAETWTDVKPPPTKLPHTS